MSTVSSRRKSPPGPAKPDPYRYGWRYVRVIRPDGTEEFDQVPLTLEDVLHPDEGDFIVESDPHDSERAYLKAVFKTRLEDPSAVVLSDCRVDWNLPGIRPLGPDVAVFFGVLRKALWSTFHVAKERARPALVIEITSPETRINDVGVKVDYYYRAKVPWYIIADVVVENDNERRIKLIAYHRTRTGYRRVEPDERGWIWLEPVRLWLGVTYDPQGGFNRLACFDPDTGAEVGDYTAISRALEEAQARAETAEARAETAEARAEAEARARATAEERIRQLEAQLKQPRKRKS